MKVKVKLLSRVRLLAIPWTAAPPGSSAHGIFQARVLEWVAVAFSRESSRPRDRTQVSHIVDRHFTSYCQQGSGKMEPTYIAGGDVKYYHHFRKQVQQFFKRLNIELLYDPAIPLPVIYPKEVKMCVQLTDVFIAVSF